MNKYDPKIIFEKAKELIPKHKLIFVSDVIALLGIATSTFYEKFPANSEEMEELKGLMETNRISIAISLRKKWFDSENATLQLALYKLIATNDERKMLQQSYVDHTSQGEKISVRVGFSDTEND